MKRFLFALGCVAATARALALDFGYTEPNRIAKAAFPEMGVIAEILVQEGDPVKQGQVLARLNAETLQQDLRIAQEQLRLQQLRFEQIEAIHATGTSSREELERAKSDLEIATLRVQRIHAQIDDRTLRAPFDGVVARINREVAESVTAAQTEVMTIVQLDSLRVTMHLAARVANRLKLDEEVDLAMDGGERARGRVAFISPVTDAASGTVRVIFAVANADGRYRSGVRCTLAGFEEEAVSRDATDVDAALPARRPRAETPAGQERR